MVEQRKADKDGEELDVIDISVVIPMLNEEENLVELTTILHSVLVDSGQEYELVFVDDGSTDDSFSVLEELHSQNARVKVVQFRNRRRSLPVLRRLRAKSLSLWMRIYRMILEKYRACWMSWTRGLI